MSPIEPSRVDEGAARVIDGEVAVHGAVLCLDPHVGVIVAHRLDSG